MQYKIFRCEALTFLCMALISTSVINSSRAQERQRREEFGSSLKRWKRDEKEQEDAESKKGGKRADSAAVIMLETSLAVFDILVLDKEGRAVSGVSKEDFVVSEDGVPREVASLSLGDGSAVPRSIVLIIAPPATGVGWNC